MSKVHPPKIPWSTLHQSSALPYRSMAGTQISGFLPGLERFLQFRCRAVVYWRCFPWRCSLLMCTVRVFGSLEGSSRISVWTRRMSWVWVDRVRVKDRWVRSWGRIWWSWLFRVLRCGDRLRRWGGRTRRRAGWFCVLRRLRILIRWFHRFRSRWRFWLVWCGWIEISGGFTRSSRCWRLVRVVRGSFIEIQGFPANWQEFMCVFISVKMTATCLGIFRIPKYLGLTRGYW